MKLHCPHCGVRGSAADSYTGQKVRCPKCQGIFEVLPDMASELPEDVPFTASLSSTPTESPLVSGEVEIPITTDEDWGGFEEEEVLSVTEDEEPEEFDGDLTEPEMETQAEEQEETLNWEDIASEIDLQLAEDEMEEEHAETMEGDPADFSTFEDELEEPAGDFGLKVKEDSETDWELDENIWVDSEEDPAEIKENDLMEESPQLEPVDSEIHIQEIEEDPAKTASITDDYEEGTLEDEAQLVQEEVQEIDEIELEPYGIDKEQCWQCGKQNSAGEPFIAQNGRLYCSDCAPIEESEDWEEMADSSQDQFTDDTLYREEPRVDDTDFTDNAPDRSYSEFSIGGAIREGWAKTKGAKGSIWAGSAVMYLVMLVIVAGGAFLLRSLNSDPTNISGLVDNILFRADTNLFPVLFPAGLLLALFIAGLLIMGVRKVAGERISWTMIFKGFSCAAKIIVATIMQSILVAIGFLLLILPGIYLAVGYTMTIPLIIDKGLSPWQAMEMSRKAVHKVWWKVAGLFSVMGLIYLGSLIPLGIGLIWTWPMFIILVGVVYRFLFGKENKTE
jgi:hypothetical protein